jgi:hypothetical protein
VTDTKENPRRTWLRLLGVAAVGAAIGAAVSALVKEDQLKEVVVAPAPRPADDPCAAERAFRFKSSDEQLARERATALRVAESLGFSRALHGSSTNDWKSFKAACGAAAGTYSVETPDAKIVQCKIAPGALTVTMNWMPGGDTLDVMIGTQRVGGWAWIEPGFKE